MSEYSEKLKHPNWQRKRLEILSRDNFECRMCGDKEESLHVHHLQYFPGNDPWAYPNSSMITLCHVCHGFEHSDFLEAKKQLISSLRCRGAISSNFYDIAVALDTSADYSRQVTQDEWRSLATIIWSCMRYRNSGGALADLVGAIEKAIQRQEI